MAVQDELPQSRITLKYRTTINGEEEEINLPKRSLVMGDLGSSKDRKADLDQRELRSITGRGNLDELMKDMGKDAKRKLSASLAKLKERLASVPDSGLTPFAREELSRGS